MPVSDLFVKIEVQHEAGEQPERIAAEICRVISKIYGVRSAELSSYVAHAETPAED